MLSYFKKRRLAKGLLHAASCLPSLNVRLKGNFGKIKRERDIKRKLLILGTSRHPPPPDHAGSATLDTLIDDTFKQVSEESCIFSYDQLYFCS